MKHRRNRREFLGLAVRIAAGGLILPAGLSCVRPGGTPPSKGPPSHWFAVDPRRCIGCGHCVRACREEFGSPPGRTRTWIERHAVSETGAVSATWPGGGEFGFPPGTVEGSKVFFLPKLCNQCSDPPCVRVCPIGASFAAPGGFVLIDRELCMGCGFCVKACPYGARFMDQVRGTAEGCDWCHGRAARGDPPVCATVCPTGARRSGRIGDGGAPEPAWMSDGKAVFLKKDFGTNPRVAYSRLGPGEGGADG